jgi:ribose 5-phosphate isomerase B
MKIAIGADHAGFYYKEQIKGSLKQNGHEVYDFGTHSDEMVDYPLFIRPVAEAVARGQYERGIVLGGSGNGEAIVANRVPGIRCALCWNRESALLARKHNDANMLSLGARMCTSEQALEIVKTWLEAPFDGGRHLRRIKQIDHKEPSPTSLPTPKLKTPESGEELRPVRPREKPRKGESQQYDVLISFRYILYSEGKNNFELRVDPGLKRPTIIHIPSVEKWNKELPEWAHGRREEILDRIKSKCVHLNCEWKEY